MRPKKCYEIIIGIQSGEKALQSSIDALDCCARVRQFASKAMASAWESLCPDENIPSIAGYFCSSAQRDIETPRLQQFRLPLDKGRCC